MDLKLGRLYEQPSPRLFKMGKYILPGTPIPQACTWSTKVIKSGGADPYPMYNNATYGDCTMAGAGHEIETLTANARSLVKPDGQTLVNEYFTLTGGQDTGLYMSQVLKYWQKTGVAGHKILAYGEVDAANQSEVMQAISVFGGIYWALDLCEAVYNANVNVLAVPWNLNGPATGDWAPDPELGHCVIVPDYESDGNGNITSMNVVTWGELKPMNYAFFAAMNSVAYVVVSKEWLEVGGVSPGGLDIAQLEADLVQV